MRIADNIFFYFLAFDTWYVLCASHVAVAPRAPAAREDIFTFFMRDVTRHKEMAGSAFVVREGTFRMLSLF